MSELADFRAHLAQVRAGDQEAITAFVRAYEPYLIRSVRRLFGSDLRHGFDSIDVSQSVMANFIIRVSHGEFELESSRDVLNLLGTMVKNKVHSRRRQEHAQRRDSTATEYVGVDTAAQEPAEGPATQAMHLELIVKARQQLTDDECQLVDWRREGLTWEEIAARRNEALVALRKRFSRMMDRVLQQLGIIDE